MLERLTTEVLPFLDEVGTPEGFESYWRRQPREGGSELLSLLAEARGYDPARDSRTAAETQLDRLAQDPRLVALLASDPAATEWIAWCDSCGRPAIRTGAPEGAMPIAMLTAMGAPTITGASCEACVSRTSAGVADQRAR